LPAPPLPRLANEKRRKTKREEGEWGGAKEMIHREDPHVPVPREAFNPCANTRSKRKKKKGRKRTPKLRYEHDGP